MRIGLVKLEIESELPEKHYISLCYVTMICLIWNIPKPKRRSVVLYGGWPGGRVAI